MRTRALLLLSTLYFGPFLFLGPLLCDGRALGAEGGDTPVQVADPSEPGEPMEIRGVLYANDGETPVADAEIFVYHTDIDGYYSGTTTRSDNPRIQATLTTNAHGAYALRSIRPGPYPAAGVPSHVHYVVRIEGQSEVRRTLQFAGDPLLGEGAYERVRGEGRFAPVRPIERDEAGVWQVEFDIRLP